MSRREARLKTRIWDDPDFLALPGPEQLAYIFFISQPDISHNGVLPLRMKRWAKKLKYKPEQLEKVLANLENARFVVVDEDEEELLVRSFLRNDEVYKQPKVLLAASRQLNEISSAKLRDEVAGEIQRILREGLAKENTRPTLLKMLGILGRVADTHTDTQVNTLSDTHSDTPSEGHAEGIPIPDAMPTGVGVGVGEELDVRSTQGSTSSRSQTSSGNGSTSKRAKKPKLADIPRPDVDELCNALVAHRIRLKCKPPVIKQEWRDEARRLLDLDKRPLDEALAVLNWSQHSEFWLSNIKSIPKFRDQYDTLRLQKEREERSSGGASSGSTAGLGKVSSREQTKKWKKGQQ